MEKSTVKIRTCAANEIMRGAWPLVVLDLQEITEEREIHNSLSSVVEHNEEDRFTLALHHYQKKDAIVRLSCDVGFAIVREYTVCVVPSESCDQVTLLKCQHVILAWSGSDEPPPDHPLHNDADTFMCQVGNEPTQCASEPLMWLRHVLERCSGGKCVLELYSQYGEAAQISVDCGLDCTCIQSTHESAQSLVGIIQPHQVNTEDILKDLSEAEKLAQNDEGKESEEDISPSETTTLTGPAGRKRLNSKSYQLRNKKQKVG